MKLPMPKTHWPRGLLLNEKQIQDLREARNKSRCYFPRSLSALAINSITTNLTRFIDVPDSPLKYLPNTIVQQLLSKIALDVKNKKMLIPFSLLTKVLGLLVNPNVTELDCTVFDSSMSTDIDFNDFLVAHSRKKCPKIRKIKLRCKRALFFTYPYHSNCGKVVLSVECFKKSWNNLTTIKICGNGLICNKDTIMFLQENFPNMEELAVCFFITESTAQTVLDHLIKMKKLHTLSIGVAEELRASLITEFIVDVAGAVPNLKNLNLLNTSDDSKFIDLFGEKYPCKNLQVDTLRIQRLQRKWPKNLTVKQLKISGYHWKNEVIEKLSTIEFTLKLALACGWAQQMYDVLDCIGELVESLIIAGLGVKSEICLERMLAACPNLQHFTFDTCGSVVQDPKHNLSPAAFKNYKSFNFNCNSIAIYSRERVLWEVFQKFLIGSEICETLTLNTFYELEIVVQVALAYPESLQQLRWLHIAPFRRVLNYSIDELHGLLVKYDKCFYELLTRCHKLERIFHLLYEKYVNMKEENRYDFTIHAIDPHFIIKHFLPALPASDEEDYDTDDSEDIE